MGLGMTEQQLKDQACQARVIYLKKLAALHNLPLEEGWDEPRIREEFKKYGIPQSGMKPNGEKSSLPRKPSAPHFAQQTEMVFDNRVDFQTGFSVGRIENNVPFMTSSERRRVLNAQKPPEDPILSAIKVGQSFQVQARWDKGVAMRWASRAKKHRVSKGIPQEMFDLRTGPDPKNPKYSRVWRIA